MTEQKLPIGTETQFGKIVKYSPAYWCVPEGESKAVAVSAELIESEEQSAAKRGTLAAKESL